MPERGVAYYSNRSHKFLPIEDETYRAVLQARTIDLSLLAIEEKYVLLLGNFEELEQELLRISLALILYTDEAWEGIGGARSALNRRVANFLSSSRLYLDHVPQDLNRAARSEASFRDHFDQLRRTLYRESFAFRLCEALRNYTQHNSLPVHVFSYGYSRDSERPEGAVTLRADFSVIVERLDRDSRFNQDVLDELRSLTEPPSLKDVIRDYMTCLARIHNSLRAQIAPEEEWCVGQIETVYNMIAVAGDVHVEGTVDLVRRSPEGALLESTHLTRRTTQRRRALQRKTNGVPELSRFRITSA